MQEPVFEASPTTCPNPDCQSTSTYVDNIDGDNIRICRDCGNSWFA